MFAELNIERAFSRVFACFLCLGLLSCQTQVQPEPEPNPDDAMARAILETLRVNTKLYPPLWINDHIKPEAQAQLMRIAHWVLEDLSIPEAQMVDATISGSIANFNYSSFSDLDLHIFVNIDTVPNPEMVEAYMRTYSSVWNDEHDISLFGLPVNIFVKNARGEEHSAGIYSVLHGKWIRKPVPTKLTVTREDVLALALPFADKIRAAVERYEEKPEGAPCSSYSALRHELRKFRKHHLEKDGELGAGNLAYKVLRRATFITSLEKTIVRCVDGTYSIQGAYAP